MAPTTPASKDHTGRYVALLVVRDESHAREVVRRYNACTTLPEPP